MKTPIKWNISTILVILVISVLSIMLTGHSKDGKEELSDMGHTVTTRQGAVTYLEKGNISFESPRAWSRFFSDTKQGFSRYMKEQNVSMLITNPEWDYYVEIAVHDAEDMSLHNFTDIQYPTISEATEETLETGEFTFTKSTYERAAFSHAEYNVVTRYTTVSEGKCIEFCCYYLSSQPITIADEVNALDAKMLPLIKGVTLGDATKNIKKETPTKLSTLSGFTFSIWILILPLIYILVCGMKIKDSDYIPNTKERRLLENGLLDESEVYGAWQKAPLGLSQSKSLLGFFAVLVVLHHLVQTIGAESASIFIVLEDFGVCLVAAFFFFSGYGLLHSLRQKPDYFKDFWKKRFSTILIPFYVCTFIFILTDILCGKKYLLKMFLGYVSGWILRNTHMWYIVEIAILYIVFYLLFRFIKKRSIALLCMFAFLVTLTAGSLLLCHGEFWFQGEWWYNSTLLFFLGLIVGEYEEPFLDLLKKHYAIYTILFTVGFLVFRQITAYMLLHHGYWTENALSNGYGDKVITLIPQLCMSFFFVILLILISLKCRFQNPVLSFLGNISLELYLIHNLFIEQLDIITGTGLYVLAVLLCSILAAALLHRFDTLLICKIQRQPVPPKKDYRPFIRQWIQEKKLASISSLCFTKRHPRDVGRQIFRTTTCVCICIISVLPIYLLFINATRTSHSLVRGPSLLPEGAFAENFSSLQLMLSYMPCSLTSAEINSIIIATGSCILATYFGSMCAYGFELFRFRGRKKLWSVIVAAMMFSQISYSVGFLILIMRLGLVNTLIPLIIPAIATPSVAYFMRMYLKIIPLKSIVEAARLDGCSELGIFHHLILPSIKPALALQIIFTFVTAWNNSFMHGLVLREPETKTISTYLQMFAGARGSSGDPTIYVLLLLTTIPPMIVYAIFSKAIISRIVLGSLKE